MRRLAFVAVIALVGLAAFVVSDLLEPEVVPIAGVIELSGTAPATGPPDEGFFIVPPRVVDFRDPSDDDPGDDDDRRGAGSTGTGGDDVDDSIDDSFDDADDSFDDD